MIAFALGMLVSASILFIASWVKSMLDMRETLEGKSWGTDPAVPMPHFETVNGVAAREARHRAMGIAIDPAGATFCRECGGSVAVRHDHCLRCNHKLIWNA